MFAFAVRAVTRAAIAMTFVVAAAFATFAAFFTLLRGLHAGKDARANGRNEPREPDSIAAEELNDCRSEKSYRETPEN
jgi:hypothetical protein